MKYQVNGRIHGEIQQLRSDSAGYSLRQIKYEQSKPTASAS